jgi:DNA-binding MarR family transcriptional regulator
MTYSFEDSLGFQVNKTANIMRNHFNEFLKPYALTAEQYVILKAINENAQIGPSQLADILGKNKTTITRIIDTLVKNDFILRQQHQSDRRSHTLVYSTKATSVMAQLIPITDQFIGKIRGKINAQELKQFLSVLSKLRTMGSLENL